MASALPSRCRCEECDTDCATVGCLRPPEPGSDVCRECRSALATQQATDAAEAAEDLRGDQQFEQAYEDAAGGAP